MLTLFAIPKPFRGHIATIQYNAIQSWMRLQPACEIILFGDDEGTAEVVREFGLRHIPYVTLSEYGTPLLNSIFAQAQAVASHRVLAYVNADIILFGDFTAAVQRIPFQRFLMVGQRWNMNLEQPLDFSHPDWQSQLCEYVRSQGTLQERCGIDYFVFTSGLWGEIPPFAIGRTVWDNWLIYRARAQGARVVDTSHAVMAVHQNHDYSHIREGKTTGWEAAWNGPEAQRNLQLAGGDYTRGFTLDDATWALPARGFVRPVLSAERLRQHWQHLLALPLPSWRLHLTRGFLAVIVAYQEKRLMSSILRRTLQMFSFSSR